MSDLVGHDWYGSGGWEGRAHCQCGWRSRPLSSYYMRQAAWQEHLKRRRAGQSDEPERIDNPHLSIRCNDDEHDNCHHLFAFGGELNEPCRCPCHQPAGDE